MKTSGFEKLIGKMMKLNNREKPGSPVTKTVHSRNLDYLRFLAVFVLLARFSTPAQASLLPSPSIRSLVYSAINKGYHIVVVTPSDHLDIGKVTVQQVLHGDHLKKGDLIRVEYNPQINSFKRVNRSLTQKKKNRNSLSIQSAILFLAPKKKKHEFSLAVGGYRFHSRQREIYRPNQVITPGPLLLQKDPIWQDWTKLTQQIKRDLSVIQKAVSIKNIENPSRRNEALFGWIKNHKTGFAAKRNTFNSPSEEKPVPNQPSGWGELGNRIFKWIYTSCKMPDIWNALVLHYQLKKEWQIDVTAPAFATKARRSFLIQVLRDHSRNSWEKRLALVQLRNSLSISSYQVKTLRKKGRCIKLKKPTPDQKKSILEAIIPYLGHLDNKIRREAYSIYLDLVHNDQKWTSPYEDVLLETSIRAYKTAQHSLHRYNMGFLIRQLGGVQTWKKASGNPRGIHVGMHELAIRKNPTGSKNHLINVILFANKKSYPLHPPFKLVAQTVDKSGRAEDTRSSPKTFKLKDRNLENPGIWKKKQRSLFLPKKKLPAGNYMLRVQGNLHPGSNRTWSTRPVFYQQGSSHKKTFPKQKEQTFSVLWNQLGSSNIRLARDAAMRLSRMDETKLIKNIRKNWTKHTRIKLERKTKLEVRKLIEDLGAKDYDTRTAKQKLLIRKARKNVQVSRFLRFRSFENASQEQRIRIQVVKSNLLPVFQYPTVERLRFLRILPVLRTHGTRKAKQFLSKLIIISH